MHVKITINMDNAAFEDGENGTEVARILRDLVAQMDGDELNAGDWLTLFDSNGNVVGKFEVKKGTAKL